MTKPAQNAISPTRNQDYPEWYQQVIKAAELAEISAVRGCMVIRPWGYGIWEGIQRELDARIKATGHENAYFPLFIPLSFLEKEAAHVEGFAKECAVVTHHRLEIKDGKLIPTGELEEPLIVRPTSETIIGESFSKWVQSYRDLPILINQWANVVRWEMRTRLFLRTTEFLWQEGHTAHSSEEEALHETMKMLDVYTELAQDVLAMPVIRGEKPAHERFPGAVNSFCIEAMMQDGKALQAGTSHYLGQNFARASNIKFLNQEGKEELAYTTSWGVSTRLIGGLIMVHGDDDGLRIPPKVAPKHVVLLPVTPSEEAKELVLPYVKKLEQELKTVSYDGQSLRVTTDLRDIRGGEKSWQWIKKGIPVRIEIGPRDIEQDCVSLMRRDRPHKERLAVKRAEVSSVLAEILSDIQEQLFKQAQARLNAQINSSLKGFEDFEAYFKQAETNSSNSVGFARSPWCGGAKCVEKLDALKVTVRCIPLEQNLNSAASCVLCAERAKHEAIFAKAY